MSIVNGPVILLVLSIIAVIIFTLWSRAIDDYERSLEDPETSTRPDQETDQ